MMQKLNLKNGYQRNSSGWLGSILGFFAMLLSPFAPIFSAATKLFFLALYAPLNLILRATPVGFLLKKWTTPNDIPGHIAAEAGKLLDKQEISQEDRLLIKDDRLGYAKLIAPENKYPTLYVDVPEDMSRSIVSDGRLVNGDAPATRLAAGTITNEFVETAWKSSVAVATRAGYCVFVLALIFSFAAIFAIGAGSGTTSEDVAEFSSAQGTSQVLLSRREAAELYQDIWTQADLDAVSKKVNVGGSFFNAAGANEKTRAVVTSIISLVLLLIASALAAAGAARYVWIGRFRFLVFQGANGAADGLRHSWREALQRWRWRLVDREMEAQAYADQVHFATQIDRSPLIEIGTSTGLMEFRGHLLAPEEHTTVKMSIVDMMQHVSVTGGSGEGKSRNVYVPIVKQLLKLRSEGYPIAIYATDDKGAIGEDIIAAAKESGLSEDDLMVIGTGPEDWRVDLMEGLEPAEFSDIVKSVSKQAGGESGDDFWPEMASDLLMTVATVLQAAEYTKGGEEWVERNGIRMYSVLNILRVASNDVEIEAAIKIVVEAMQDKDGEYRKIAHLDKNSLHAALDYLAGSWLTLVDATKDGIRANARKALRMFAFNDAISAGYADGVGARILPTNELLSNKIKICNISQIEHGTAGRLVAIMLKTLFFKLARASEQKDPQSAKDRLSWWFNPDLNAFNKHKFTLNFFIADEYQSLVTASRDDGLSDASVWNVLRSAGVCGILLTQSLTAYKMAVGDKAADNMRSNWRTRIMLRTEDVPTIEEAKRLGGKVMRFNSFAWDHLESAVATKRETGIHADTLQHAKWNDDYEAIPVLLSPGHFSDYEISGYENAFDVDDRFVVTSSDYNDTSSIGTEQAAAWRQEDRTMSIMQHGSSEVEAVRDEDLMQMGRGRALVFVQRAGGTRVDIVKLPG